MACRGIDMGKKVGILTIYYKTINYGAMLQAYALVKAIESLGYDVEQITYDRFHDAQDIYKILDKTKPKPRQHKLFTVIRENGLFYPFKYYLHKRAAFNDNVKKEMELRYRAIERFGRSIPHSETVYIYDNLTSSLKEYDTYVVGSDQVWSPFLFRRAFFCDFVDDSQVKCIAYAVSISQSRLSEKCQEIYREKLRRFSAISLRENNKEVIQHLTDVPIEWAVDPTLLLEKKQWDEIARERLVPEEYVFCYFLNPDKKERELATLFAKNRRLKLVTIPFVSGNYIENDYKFGNIRMTSASPEEWISLIKYAKYIFTDSFHGTAFAHIYHKQFFSFIADDQNRERAIRISALLALYGTENRFCVSEDTKNIDYLMRTRDIDYSKESKEIVKRKEESFNFLKRSLNRS